MRWGEGCNAHDKYLFSVGWVLKNLHATFCNQTWYHGAQPWAGMPCKKNGILSSGQGHSMGLYNQNMTVSAISYVSSKLTSLLQPDWIQQ